MKKKFFFLLTIFLAFSSLAQTNKKEAVAIRVTLIGDAYLASESFSQAIYHYKKALSAYPGYVKTQFQLAQSYRLSSQLDSAAFHYQAIIDDEQDLRYPMARYYLGMMQLDKNEFHSAHNNLVKFNQLLTEQKLHDLERYRDFFEQAQTEIDKLESE